MIVIESKRRKRKSTLKNMPKSRLYHIRKM
ncbi:unknown [Prevotella sp. CAG:520]|nr:unknown [Prevotella sp. CAG:520]